MDENMKLIMAAFARINAKSDNIDMGVTGLDSRMTDVEKR